MNTSLGAGMLPCWRSLPLFRRAHVVRAYPCQALPGREAQLALYVIQVVGGKEQRTCSLVNRLLSDSIQECFVPQREVMRRAEGQWTSVRETLFPGYLFVETNDIKHVMERLARVPAFTRLLGVSDEKVIPLSPDEVTWLTALMQPLDKVVEMSVGVIEGDRIVVTDGPLVGHEALISKIDRHKRLAWLDMRMFGRTKTIKVGLEIVRKSA